MFEINVTAHGKDITFTIDKVQRGYELRQVDADGAPLTVWNFDMLAGKTVAAWGMRVDGIIEITTKCEEC